ncbi:MAG: VWA domain-containing protein [Acidobacteria bacterium]|nr:VWA domain-containing protein [Acidobacteriota bacterium]
MHAMKGAPDLAALRERWFRRWPEALAQWSRFTQLRDPRWCATEGDEANESLSGSFAMIRLDDHGVVISLRQIAELGLEDFPVEVLAHEIGHHVYCPGNLGDHARMIARMRRALAPMLDRAPLVANLYGDLLINDRLQRAGGLRMAELYGRIRGPEESTELWRFYLRTYEILWSLPKGALAPGEITQKIDVDALLASRVVRSFAKDWLRGAGRYAALCFPYLESLPPEKLAREAGRWLDAKGASVDEIPDGLAEIDDDELDGAIHPALDPDLSGIDWDEEREAMPTGATKTGDTTPRQRYREPFDYKEILRSVGVTLSDEELTIRYYRERALPNLIRFPVRELPRSTDPLPEGLETWEAGDAMESLDVVESLMASSTLIPGVTTVQRTWGTSPGNDPEREPIDLYLGVDCSGSMSNPAVTMSYPVLAGAIIALSALRAGARVMVCLSGEPGSFSATDGFIRNEHEVLKTLTGYLGTGYSFGIHRLKFAFADRKPSDRPAHIMIVTDHDIFAMLGERDGTTVGWERAKLSLDAARGGGTYVLHMDAKWSPHESQRMRDDGWGVHFVNDWKEMVEFAREFSRRTWERQAERQVKSHRS